MHESNLVKVPIPVGVNLYVGRFPKTHEEDADISWVHMPVELEFVFMQDLYQTWHYSCSGSFEKIYFKIRERALEKCKEGLHIFVWHHRLSNLVPGKSYTRQCNKCT